MGVKIQQIVRRLGHISLSCLVCAPTQRVVKRSAQSRPLFASKSAASSGIDVATRISLRGGCSNARRWTISGLQPQVTIDELKFAALTWG
jgi:hypothetical protein